MSNPKSLTARLVLAAFLWVGTVLGLGGTALAFAFAETAERGFEARLDALLRGMVASVEFSPQTAIRFARPLGEPRFEQIFSGWYWQVSDGDRILARSRSLWDQDLPVHQTQDQSGAREIGRMTGPQNQALLVLERDLIFPNKADPVHVLVAADLAELHEDAQNFNRLLALSLTLLGLGLVAGVVVQVRFGLKPLRALAGDLDAIRRSPDRRLDGVYPAEIAPVVDAMNAVLEHDSTMMARSKTHLGNLAHALKTPLSVLRAECDGKAAEQVAVMNRLVEHHLTRARAQANSARALKRRIALAPVAEGVVAVLARLYPETAINVDLAPQCDFPGEAEDIEEMLGNVLENACKWAGRQVRLTARTQDGALILVIEDDGPGMTQAEIETAQKRGARLDEHIPGWGLGLSILDDLVEMNGGQLCYGRSQWGGLRVEMEFAATE